MRCLLTSLFCFILISGYGQQVANDMSVRYVKIASGLRIAYHEMGEGTHSLIFIHGLGSNRKAWDKNISALSASNRCIALDLPGYGLSDGGDHAYDMAFFAGVLREFAEAIEARNPILVGHSMGGQIALYAAQQYPGFASGLALLAPAGFETFTPEEQAWFQMVYTPQVLRNTPPDQIRRNFEINFFRFPEDAEFMIAERMALRERPEAYAAYCDMIPRCVMGMLRQPVFERLPEIKIPALVVYGERDYLIPNRLLHQTLSTAEVAQKGAGRLPLATLRLLPSCGHFLQWECAEAINDAVADFLQRN